MALETIIEKKSPFAFDPQDPLALRLQQTSDQISAIREIFGLPANTTVCIINGRLVGPIDKDGPKPWAV